MIKYDPKTLHTFPGAECFGYDNGTSLDGFTILPVNLIRWTRGRNDDQGLIIGKIGNLIPKAYYGILEPISAMAYLDDNTYYPYDGTHRIALMYFLFGEKAHVVLAKPPSKIGDIDINPSSVPVTTQRDFSRDSGYTNDQLTTIVVTSMRDLDKMERNARTWKKHFGFFYSKPDRDNTGLANCERTNPVLLNRFS